MFIIFVNLRADIGSKLKNKEKDERRRRRTIKRKMKEEEGADMGG